MLVSCATENGRVSGLLFDVEDFLWAILLHDLSAVFVLFLWRALSLQPTEVLGRTRVFRPLPL